MWGRGWLAPAYPPPSRTSDCDGDAGASRTPSAGRAATPVHPTHPQCKTHSSGACGKAAAATPPALRRGIPAAGTQRGRAHLAAADGCGHKVEELVGRRADVKGPAVPDDQAVRLRPRQQLRVAPAVVDKGVLASSRSWAEGARAAWRSDSGIGGKHVDPAQPRPSSRMQAATCEEKQSTAAAAPVGSSGQLRHWVMPRPRRQVGAVATATARAHRFGYISERTLP